MDAATFPVGPLDMNSPGKGVPTNATLSKPDAEQATQVSECIEASYINEIECKNETIIPHFPERHTLIYARCRHAESGSSPTSHHGSFFTI